MDVDPDPPHATMRLPLAALALSAPLSAQIEMNLLGTIDLDPASTGGSPSFIGTNPSAVAWNGSDLYVAGFNNQTTADTVAIVRIVDPLGAATVAPAFGQVSTPSFRGYSGLDFFGSRVFASYDDGTTHPNGIQSFNTFGFQPWSKSARGSSGVAWDPGFPGGNPQLGTGCAWTRFDQTKRALQDPDNGADIWTAADGMSLANDQGAFFRDMDFDRDSGDVWLREGNNVLRGPRVADNATAPVVTVVDVPDADFVNGQNLAYLNRESGDFVIYNDRGTTASGQDFFSVVRVIQTDGTPAVVDWLGFSAPTNNGYYDFDWDPITGTLAILDFTNRKCHLFEVRDTPPLTGGPTSISIAAGGTQSLSLAAGPGFAGQLYLVGGSLSGTTPGIALDGQLLPLNVDLYFLTSIQNAGTAPFVNTFGALDAQGAASASLVIPAGAAPAALAGLTAHHAFLLLDLFGGPTPAVSFASNALALDFTP